MSKIDLADESDSVQSPRQPRAARKNLAGLDLDPEGDDEYREGEEELDETIAKDDDEEEEDDEDDEDDEVVKPKRGRKRKATDEPEDEEKTGENDEDTGEAEVKDENKEEAVPLKRKGKKRGRKPKIPRPEDVYFDEKGNEIDIKNDEVVMEDEDPKGVAKIDENGFLQGGRRFRVKTFTLLGKGERQYMVSTEPARLVGFRDSYLLFKTHLLLFKKVCTHEEKMDLIQRHLIPTSYKGRSVNLVTARSIFREFGARMLVGGKKVEDDFWEQKAIDRGDVAGEFADPEEAAATMGPNFGPGDHNPYQAQVTGSALVNYQTDPTWLYQVSLQTVEFNQTLTEQRNQVWLRGVKDTYSGFNFYPQASQPTRARLEKVAAVADDDETIECSIRYYSPNVRRKVTGLALVPQDVFADVDAEVKAAILEQQAYERLVQW